MAASASTATRVAGAESSTSSMTTFQATTCITSEPAIQLPDELWLTILESPCTFPSEIFTDVMLDLIKNPNITSSYLFRADVCYDSDNDYSLERSGDGSMQSTLLRQLKRDYQPISFSLDGHEITRTMVRKLVPRNPQLDDALIQTCHLLRNTTAQPETTMVVYIPHVQDAERMPFYHPSVSRIAFIHKWPLITPTQPPANQDSASISVSYCLFRDTPLTTKLERTALRLLQTIHKHGQGLLGGYEKRVHLDQVIPQKRYQDTYARLKAKYGRHLAESWVEVTDPGKHVFEDVGIAAFLIELWRDMYSAPTVPAADGASANGDLDPKGQKPSFPGFVDIGCGNGVLVYILLSEGYEGWGFDARERKTWRVLPENITQKLQRRILVPEIFQEVDPAQQDALWHNGQFQRGTFIISNHADELTAWTPLLAYQNHSAFVAIPCCSHDFTGARFRAPASVKTTANGPERLPQQSVPPQQDEGVETLEGVSKPQAAETGSLRRSVVQKKMQSAYSTLCSYVTSLAEEIGYSVQNEMLRIPSTRNYCIIGRIRGGEIGNYEARKIEVIDIVERELKMSINAASSAWIGKVEKLSIKPGSGH